MGTSEILLTDLQEAALPFPGDVDGHPAFALRVRDALPGSVPTGAGDHVIGYSSTCTHMGCQLTSGADPIVHPASAVCGPCPCHGTTFDLARRGLVILGPATQSLPLLALNVTGGKIVANGWVADAPPSNDWPPVEDATAKALLLRRFNEGTRQDLVDLDGIGDVLADAVIERRNALPFSSFDEIAQISGIGAESLSDILAAYIEEAV